MADCGTCAASREKIVALVDKAAALVQEKGENAFTEFRKKDSEWFHGDVYIFVDDMDGKNLCHPVRPDLEGKNLLDIKDADGKEFVREMIGLLKEKDAGWVEYSWTKPGATSASKKLAYVKKTTLDGKPVLVGSGIYAD
jgi:signal transduction histidine kinase